MKDILDAIETIRDYTGDMTYEEFKDDRRTVDAVVRNFEIIGEAASNIPEDVRDRYDQLEWRGTINFRNVMIHDYFRVDTGRVWDTIQNNLPELERTMKTIYDEEK